MLTYRYKNRSLFYIDYDPTEKAGTSGLAFYAFFRARLRSRNPSIKR